MMEKLLLSLCAAAGILVAGCSDPSDGESDIRIAPSITRVDGVNFTEGDRIGVTVSLSSGDYAANRLMTYDGLFFSAAGLVWYDEAQGASTFTAYYPYRDEGVPGTFAVAADQRDGCTPSDLLGAVTRDVLPGSTPVKMQFHHLLSQLNIVVQNRSDRAVRQVAIDGFVPEAAVDLAVPEATVRAGEAVEVLALPSLRMLFTGRCLSRSGPPCRSMSRSRTAPWRANRCQMRLLRAASATTCR